MIDLEKYIEDAQRTVSDTDKVVINPQLLYNALNLFANAATILDKLKAHIYYRKPLDKTSIVKALTLIAEAHRRLQYVSLEPHDQELISQNLNINPHILHAMLGIGSEAGEMIRLIRFNQEMSKIDIIEELGDQHWFQALLVDALDIDWDSVFTGNIEKLRVRYPDSFQIDVSRERDKEKELDAIKEKLVEKPKVRRTPRKKKAAA